MKSIVPIFEVVIVLLLSVLLALPAGAQDKKALKFFTEAQTDYRNHDEEDALAKLKEVIHRDSEFVDAYILLADVYNEMDSTEQQIAALKRAISIDDKKFPKAYYVLANACYRIGDYRGAQEAYQQFLETGAAANLEEKTKKQITACETALELVQNGVPFQPEILEGCINSASDEYWPSLTIDGKTMIFTRLVSTGNRVNELMPRFQEDFYQAQLVDGSWCDCEPLNSINTKENEGAQSVSADGKLIFFTACNQAGGYGSCDIYFTRMIGGEWTKPENAGSPVNSGAWESQPSISANGEYLYFVSNRKGGHGGMDIWRCRLKGFSLNGKPEWGNLENLGDSVNTAGNESSPFVHADGVTLYFASDSWPGLGGNDLFISRLTNDTAWSCPLNLGYPINSYKDEQGMIVDASGQNAYYSSDRTGSQGIDIYRFGLNENTRPIPVSYVKGIVYDRTDGTPLQTEVELFDVDQDQLVARSESSPDKGEFVMCLPLGKEYAFNISKKGYLFFSENYALTQVRELTNPFSVEIGLEPVKVGNSTILRNVFFDTDSYELLPQSKAELDKLVQFMTQNVGVAIEIGGHTDNVGTAEYNLALSENRAKAVYQYLLNEGVGVDRLTYKGYGFDQPVVSNDTDEGRSQNRRTEFKIINVSK